MKYKPLVSVVIPTYRRKLYVEEAIQSVLNQTYDNIEIIVTDDNAENNEFRQYILNILQKYPMCRCLLNDKNLGGSLNRNEGIKAAKGELVSFLDDDDVYEPTRIEKVVDLYLKHIDDDIGLIMTWCFDCDDKLNIKGAYKLQLSDNPLFQHMGSCLCATSQWTVPVKAFNKVGMFEDTPNKQDSIMLLKLLGADMKILCVEECLSKFRNHANGRISGNYEKHIIGETIYHQWCMKYYHKLSCSQINEVERRFALQLAYNNRGAYNNLVAFKYYIKAIYLGGIAKENLIYLPEMILGPQIFERLRRIMSKIKRSLLK